MPYEPFPEPTFTQSRYTRVLLIGGGILAGVLLILLLLYYSLAWAVAHRRGAPEPPAPPSGFSVAPFTVRTSDGLTLRGWTAAGKPDLPQVILVHGLRADRRQMIPQALWLQRQGYTVWLFDFRAHGESEGEWIGFGALEQADLIAVAAEARKTYPNAPLIVWGLSMGAATALWAGPEIPGLSGIVAESPFDSIPETFRHHGGLSLGALGSEIMPYVLTLCGRLAGFDPLKDSPRAALERLGNVPILFVAGQSDQRMPPEMIRRLSTAHPGRHEVLELPGTHARIFESAPSRYAEGVQKLIESVRTDSPRP